MKKTFRQKVYDIFRLTYRFRLFYVRTRMELPIILNKRGLNGRGVEVGVWKGEFSEFILKNWNGKVLYSIDPWHSFMENEYPDDMNIAQHDFDMIANSVSDLLSPFGNKSEIIRKTSVDAVQQFQFNTLDFVYLDGRHHYDGVKEDIEYWYTKIKPGGLLCGHDYLDGVVNSTQFGVKQAVDEFATKNHLEVLVTAKDEYPSWFIIKT